MTEPAMSTSFFDVLVQMGGSVTLLAFLASGLILAGFSGLKRLRRRARPAAAAKAINSEVMLDALERTRFERRTLMGKEELRLYRCLEAWERRQKKGYMVLAGVPLGSVVAPKGADTDLAATPGLSALDRVRMDFLVIDKTGAPALGVDMPGRAVGNDAEARDAALRQIVFDKARLPMLAPEAGTSAADVVSKIDYLLNTGLMKHDAAEKPARQRPAGDGAVAQVA